MFAETQTSSESAQPCEAAPPSKKIWEKAVDSFVAEHTHGSTIRDDALYELLGVAYPGAQVPYAEANRSKLEFLPLFKQFRSKLLTDHNMLLVSLYSNGVYRVLLPKEQTAYAVQKSQDEFRKAREDLQERLCHVEQSALSDIEKQQNADAKTRAANLASMHKSVWARNRKS